MHVTAAVKMKRVLYDPNEAKTVGFVSQLLLKKIKN
jgi:hypothetical protein